MNASNIGNLQAGDVALNPDDSAEALHHSLQPGAFFILPLDLAEAWHKNLQQGVTDPRIQSLCASSFRMGQLSCAAVEYSAGYTTGWRWGVTCGAVGTVLIGVAVFLTGVAGFVP